MNKFPGVIADPIRMDHESILENLSIGVFRLGLDPPGLFLGVNPTFLNMLGYQAENDIQGISIASHFLSSADWDRFTADVLSNGEVENFEVQLQGCDGASLWTSITARLVNPGGLGGAWIDGAIENIDQQKFEQMRCSNPRGILDQLTGLVEQLPMGIILLDVQRRPVVVNSLGSEMLAWFGHQKKDSTLLALGSHSIDEMIGLFNHSNPLEIIHEGPHPKIFEIEIHPLSGEQLRWILMLRDITQERYDQSRIQMQDRLATVGQLAAGIAHDFNNIMATILVYSDLLKKVLSDQPSSLEQLAIIQGQVHRASSLIRQILDFSRQSVIEPCSMDLLPFIKEFIRLLDRVLPETIRADFKIHPGDYQVIVDPAQLQQVFMNQAINARDAMPGGGVLSLELRSMLIKAGDIPPAPYLPEGTWIAVTISDTGVGIAPDVLPHIFEPFFTTKPVGEGTGLGLAQAYGIIKQHGGYIDVQSEVGAGSSFTIYLPASPTHRIEQGEVCYAAPLEGHGQTILVVEDDETTLNALQDLLEAQEYHVLAAANGIEALRILEGKSSSIDLLVSDLVMPEMGGIALTSQVQERWPRMRTLFVTGHPVDIEGQTLLQEREITWLQKPFTVPEFFHTVEEILAAA